MTDARSFQEPVEAIVQPVPDARSFQEPVEAIVTPVPNAVSYQEPVEAIVTPVPVARSYQEVVEAIVHPTTDSRSYQLVVEVLDCGGRLAAEGQWWPRGGVAMSLTGSLVTGMAVVWPPATIPSGFLRADGSAVSRSTYAALFALYGVMYGAGDGSTTFNLPNWVAPAPWIIKT